MKVGWKKIPPSANGAVFVVGKMVLKFAYRLTFALVVLATLASSAAPHDFSTSYSRMKVRGGTVEVQFTFNRRDFHAADAVKAIEGNYYVGAPEAPSGMVVRRSD